jgi:transposase
VGEGDEDRFHVAKAYFEWEYTKAGAKRAIRAWCKWVQASGLYYFDSFLTTLERWIDEITNYFDDRQMNGFVEGFNNRFKVLKGVARGSSM